MPKVSVVMPAYNAEKYIGEAIESILNQTYTDFEFIIINDGSTDRTKEIILEYDDPRIVLLENEKNSGIVVTLNKGLDAAKGEYIARMDADDISLCNRIERQVMFLDSHKHIGVVGSALQVFGDGIDNQNRFFSDSKEKLKAELLFSSCLAHPTVMFRCSLIRKSNACYDLQFAGIEDYALWWTLAQITDLGCINEILLKYRSHEKQITKDKSDARLERSFRFLEHRLQTLQITLNEEEKKALIMYSYSNWDYFNSDTLRLFVDTLARIYKNNIAKPFFEQNALKRVTGFAVLVSSNNAKIYGTEKIKVQIGAVSKGILSPVLACKYYVSSFI